MRKKIEYVYVVYLEPSGDTFYFKTKPSMDTIWELMKKEGYRGYEKEELKDVVYIDKVKLRE